MKTVERRSKQAQRPSKPAVGMAVRIAGRVEIPASVRDYQSFREWARSPGCPEHLRVAFFNDVLWVDPDMEQIYDHNLVIHRIGMVLGPLAEDRGLYGGDGVLVSNPAARLATVPDGYFASDEAFDAGRVREVEGKTHGFVELEGSPEMVLEVVSDSSETKDLVELRDLYWRAGIAEYWLVDARGDAPIFELLRWGPRGYVAARKQPGGWQKSEVFGRSFRMTRKKSRRGRSIDTLEIK